MWVATASMPEGNGWRTFTWDMGLLSDGYVFRFSGMTVNGAYVSIVGAVNHNQ